MSKGRVPPQVHRVLAKAKLAEKARKRAAALAERRAKAVASPATPDPSPPREERP